MTKNIICIILLANCISMTGCSFFEKKPVEYAQQKDLPKELQDAQKALDEEKARKAYGIVKKWIKKHPKHPNMEEALILKAKATKARGFHYQAAVIYNKVLDEFTATDQFNHILHEQVQIAQDLINGKKRRILGFIWITARQDAVELLDKVVSRWPGSDLALTALKIQASYFYQKKDFIQAQQTYQFIIDNYASSNFLNEALWYNAESTYHQFQDIYNDSNSLVEARIRYRQSQLAGLPVNITRSDIQERLASIENKLAQKEFHIADYYYRTKRMEQARHYWKYILETWPESEWAKKSQDNLTNL